MKKNTVVKLIILGGVLGNTQAARATDIGLPLYADDMEKKGSIELYYEQYSRDAELQLPSIGFSAYGEHEEERIIFRANYHASPRIALYAEAGSTEMTDDPNAIGGKVPLFGAGLRIKVYDGALFNLSAFASATYTPKIEYRYEGPSLRGGDIASFQERSYTEVNGGLILAKMIPLGSSFSCMPYGGVMVSELDGDERVTNIYKDNNEVEKIDGALLDDGQISLFAGLGLMLNDSWGLRAEGRFVNQTSFSGGLTYFF